ncbi:hypothetical protein NL676_027915 [Syzygium grande]|nr:hypothetical protein NL676_027915 [Syzygium grande]
MCHDARFAGASIMLRVEACSIAVVGGGCPDHEKCRETCIPCWRGVGQIASYCRPAGGGIPYDQCICDFKNGAPCPPPGLPKCPPSGLYQISH